MSGSAATTFNHGAVSRRTFLGAAASCSAHLMFMPAMPPGARRFMLAGRRRQVVVEEPWGRLEQVGEGLWALVSTPLTGDRTTLCNGGIIAGEHGTLLVESFASPAGATWMGEQARKLTGRWPTHVVLTHFHGDHTNGIEGYEASRMPAIMATEVTRDLVRRADSDRELAPDSPRPRLLSDVVILDPSQETVVDLGGRSVQVVPREGHTPSDVTVELDDPGVVWCGDLVWNHMFPNYRDAIPSRLSRYVRALVRSRETVYVPGHGALADARDLDNYIAVIDLVEQAGRSAHDRGIPAAQAAKEFRIPEALGEWIMFSSRYYEVALGAWEKELAGDGQ